MEIKGLTLAELKIVCAVLINSTYKLADANLVIPIYQKLVEKVKELEPPKQEEAVKEDNGHK